MTAYNDVVVNGQIVKISPVDFCCHSAPW